MTVEVLPQKSNLSISGVGQRWSLVEKVGGLDSYLAFRPPTNQTVGPHQRELGIVKLGARFFVVYEASHSHCSILCYGTFFVPQQSRGVYGMLSIFIPHHIVLQ